MMITKWVETAESNTHTRVSRVNIQNMHLDISDSRVTIQQYKMDLIQILDLASARTVDNDLTSPEYLYNELNFEID
jgi:hypothetical protein